MRDDMIHRVPRLRRKPLDDGGCFALDYVVGEDQTEPRRTLVLTLKSGQPGVRHSAALLR
jgi:hypothetical protein